MAETNGATKEWSARELQAAMEKLHDVIEKGNRPQRQAATATFGGFGHAPDWNDNRLSQRLKAVQPYDRGMIEMMARQRGGLKLSGVGPYACQMAGLAAKAINHTGTIQKLAEQGLWSQNYSEENFLKQFSVRPAGASYVIKAGGGFEIRKAPLAEGSGVTGGYTVPPQFMNELLTIAAEDGFIEPRCKVLPMNSRTADWPMLDITTAQAAGTSPYFGGILAAWQPEAATINETEPAFKQSTWTAWDLVLYTVSSNQLLADNGIGLDALLTQLFGQAITWYKEYAFLRGLGAGSSMPLGIANAPATYVQGRSVASRFLLADAAAMMSHLQIRSWDDACWIMHQSVLPQLIQMVDGGFANTAASASYIAGNRPMWISPIGDGKVGGYAMKLPQAFLNGLPVYFTEKLPQLGTKGDVMLVDWSRYVIGNRLDLQIDVSPHYLFRNNQLAWRVISRCDGKPWLNSTITDANGWVVSPFVVLS